ENIVTDQSQINVKVGLTSVVDMKMPIGTSNIIEAIKTELQKHVAEGVTIKVEAVEGSKDTYSVTMTSGEYSQSKNMIGVILKADSYITKGAEIANNKASFTWGSQNGIGTKDQLDNTSGSSYKYFSDGAYITLQVLDNNKKIVKMSDVFEKITLKTGDDGKVDTIPHSNREKGDFGFDEFESYKTVLAQAAGDNSVFYGLRQSKGVAHTVGFNPGEVRKINLSVSPKKGIQVGEYTVRVNVAQQGESGVFTSIGKPIEYKFVVDNISATIEEGDLSLNQKENSIDKLTSKIKVAAKYEDISKAKITGVTYTSSNSIVVDSKTDALELIAKNPGTSTITVNSVMIDKDGNLSTTNDVEKVNIEGNNIVNLDCRDMGIVSHTFKEKIGSTEPGFGTVDWKESPFKHTTDGAFFTIELINPDNKRVLFDSGFNKFSLQTVGSVNVQEYTEGLRKQTDFGRDVSHTGTKFLSTGGIKETSLKGIMFYGIHSDIYGVNVEAGQELAIQVKGDAKIDLTGYSIKIKAYSKVRPTKDTKYTEEEFNKLTPIAEKIINL
ncbi:MAG: hypothetical protein RR840_06725, partial [Clostridium sp.]